mgnify:CR=1 FL=1
MLTAQYDAKRFEIVQDEPDVGVYLYVYDNDQCVRDLLQNDTETCIEIAFEEYGIPKDGWQQVPDAADFKK